MEFLKYFDFFTIRFHFYVGGQPSNNSKFGGIMNIICFIGCLVTIFLFSLDDLRRLNPISSKSEIPGAEIRVVNLNKNKIWIPWRMVTYEEKFVDHRGILFPIISLVEGHWNDSYGMNLTYHKLNYKLCNETSMINKTDEYKIDVPLNELFCLENDDIPWGGSWLGNILYYVEINLYLCQDGINFNSSDPKCTKMTDLLKHRNTSWLFEFYFPVVQFQPTNFDVPMAVIYRSYYYRLSTYANKVERIYVKENVLSDYKSIFDNSYTNSSYWGVDNNLYGDSYFSPDESDPLVKSTSSRLYSLVIYMDQGYNFYTRSYKKIFQIISDVFPILNFIYFFFKRVTRGVKLTFAKKTAAELLFENVKLRQNINITNTIKHNLNTNSHFNLDSEINNKSRNENMNNNQQSNHKINFNTNIKAFRKTYLSKKKLKFGDRGSAILMINKDKFPINRFSSNAVGLIEVLNKKEIKRNSHYINNSNSLQLDLSNHNIFKKKKIKQNDLFPIYYYFMDFFIDKLVRPKSFCYLDNRYLIVYNFLGHIFDISSHILLFKNFNILKNLFVSEITDGKKKIKIFDNSKRININDNALMDEVSRDLKAQSCDIFTKTILV